MNKIKYRFLEPKERIALIKVLDSKKNMYRNLEKKHEALHEELYECRRELNSIKRKIETGKERIESKS